FYFEPILFKPDIIFYLLFLSLPIVMLSAFLLKKFTNPKRFTFFFSQPVYQAPAVVVMTIILLLVSFNREQKYKILIDYCADNQEWRKVLDLSSKLKKYDLYVNFNVNRALFHTGQMLDNLFSYPQIIGPDGLFINRFIAGQIAIPTSDLYFELGHVNAAQAYAYEGQAKYKYNPRILKRLVFTNIINEKYAAAEKFIKLLKKSPVHRNWAIKYGKYLTDHSLIEKDKLFAMKRSQKPKTDFFISNKLPYYDLEQLVKENSENRMAFEYLMAYYLLDCKIGNIINNIQNFKRPAYNRIPRNIQEALLIIQVISAGSGQHEAVDLRKYIQITTLNDFKEFTRLLVPDKNISQQRVEKKFKNTYWYYVRYVNPKETNVNIQGVKVREKLF
ncbi:hypothetical protein JW935_25725, partial [candidate division KSB1 bacterium]|nr:hypothetical protein [candidate division KSB1 bacterium]